MTVRELIEHLSKLDGDLPVIMGSDDEGNDFIEPYTPSESWAVEDDSMRCGLYPVHPDDVGTEYDEAELVRVVVM
jgi:hypothetical protein